MATTTRQRRSKEEWDRIARDEIVPALQGGTKMGEIYERYGGSGERIRRAIAEVGFDTKGQPLQEVQITGSRPSTIANRVAKRRREGISWWKLERETGKSARELKELLRKHGHEALTVGHVARDGAETEEVETPGEAPVEAEEPIAAVEG